MVLVLSAVVVVGYLTLLSTMTVMMLTREGESYDDDDDDNIIKNKQEKTCTLIHMAIPADRNVVQKEKE
jgi:hypothetical protein